MTIKKFQGRTEEEAIAKAREEFGAGTVIMNIKEVRPKGFFRSFKAPLIEVTAAIEEVDTLGSNLETGAREFNLRSGSLRWSLNPRSGLSVQ